MKVTKIDTFAGHRDSVYCLLDSKEKNGRFYSSGADGMVVVWDLEKPDMGKLIARVGGSVYALAFDHAAQNLWIGQNFEGVQLIKPELKQAAGSLKVTTSAIFDIQLAGNEAYLAFGDGVIAVLDVPDLLVKKHVKVGDKSVRALAISDDQAHLAAGTSDAHVRIFDRQTMQPLFNLEGHMNSVFTARYSPDGRFLLTAGRDAHFRVWDVKQDYQLVQDVAAHMYALNHIAFSPDGSMFATCSMDKSIKLWDAATFRLLKVIDRSRHAGHGTSVNKLLWSSFENLLLSASDDRMISVWEISKE